MDRVPSGAQPLDVLAAAAADGVGEVRIAIDLRDPLAAMTVSPGQYQLCIHNAGLYLNPCEWGAANIGTVTSSGTVTVPLRLRKGAWFIVRVHDQAGHLPQTEAVSHLPVDGLAVRLDELLADGLRRGTAEQP